MKRKKTIWVTFAVVLVCLAAAALYVRNVSKPIPASPEQAAYLPSLLRDTSHVVIRLPPKCGEQVFAVISDPAEVRGFVAATRIADMECLCACFGYIDIDYINATGQTNTLNYNVSEGYIKYSNPWSIQAKAPNDLRRLVASHLPKP